MRKWVVLFAALLTMACTTAMPGTTMGGVLPDVPKDIEPYPERPLRYCGEQFGVFIRIYDTNPEGQGGVFEYGAFEIRDGEPYFSMPVLQIQQNTEGDLVFIGVDNNGVRETFKTIEEFKEKYTEDPCALPFLPTSEKAEIPRNKVD